MTTPPRPTRAPHTPPPRAATGGAKPGTVKNGGGFNPSFNPTLAVNIARMRAAGGGAGPGAGPAGGRSGNGSTGTPGGDFMSNEDIRAFTEYLRKNARQRAVERAMDAAQLEAVLRNIPDAAGSMAGARMRARRVSRWLKRIARAEQLIAKWATALYAAFEREFEAELRKVGKARTQVKQNRPKFGWR